MGRCRLHAETSDELVGKTDFDYFPIEHAQEAFDDEMRIISTGQPVLGIIERETAPGMPEKYNKVALKIMKKNGIMVNDLHAFVLPRMDELQRPNNVHFTEAGSRALAGQFTKVINDILR